MNGIFFYWNEWIRTTLVGRVENFYSIVMHLLRHLSDMLIDLDMRMRYQYDRLWCVILVYVKIIASCSNNKIHIHNRLTCAILTPYWANIASYNDIKPDWPTAAAARGSSKVYASYVVQKKIHLYVKFIIHIMYIYYSI